MVIMNTIKAFLRSLSGRLLSGYTLIHLSMTVILLSTVLHFLETGMKEQFIDDARSKAGLIASSFAAIDPVSNRRMITSIMDELILSSNVVYAELVLPGNESVKGEVNLFTNMPSFIEDLEFDQHGDDAYFIALPVYTASTNTASLLRIGFDEQPLTEQIRYASMILIFIIGLFFVLSLALIYFLSEHTIKPLQSLRAASRQIRMGQISTHLDVDSPVTDICELASDLDLMRNELVKQASTLQHQALHDALTGLPNRLLLDERMQQAILLHERNGEPFTLLLLDLDRFKEINDTLGHQVGDEVLRQTASRIRSLVRASDTVARLGGDEFAILLLGSDNSANRVAESIISSIQRAYTIDNHVLRIGVSIGIAFYPNSRKSANEIIRQADVAMYEAKRSGSHYTTYHSRHDARARELLTLHNELQEAIQDGQIILYYQPKIDLQSGAVAGVEALARWQHPARGLLTADKFIPLAEKNNIINLLTQALLHQAVQDASNWNRSGQPLEVSFNLSPKNMLDDDLVISISGILEEFDLPPHLLSLELTENALIQNPSHASDILLLLKQMGIRSIIDDFGTGYSSLAYLRQLPVTEIKIDKSFVLDMVNNSDDYHIVKAIIRMAHDLDLSVTAEGIENMAVANRLARLRCDRGQGFFYTPALPVDEFNTWLDGYNGSALAGISHT